MQALMDSRRRQTNGTVSSALLAKKIRWKAAVLCSAEKSSMKRSTDFRSMTVIKTLPHLTDTGGTDCHGNPPHVPQAETASCANPVPGLNPADRAGKRSFAPTAESMISTKKSPSSPSRISFLFDPSKGYVDSALYLSQTGEIDFKLRAAPSTPPYYGGQRRGQSDQSDPSHAGLSGGQSRIFRGTHGGSV